MKKSKSALVSAAVAGLLLGGVATTASSCQSSPSQSMAQGHIEKHACKAMNSCKGQGGCKTDKNACAGKNACKGQGGCAVPKR